MTALEERNTMIGWIGEATLAGARQAPACKVLGTERAYGAALAKRRI